MKCIRCQSIHEQYTPTTSRRVIKFRWAQKPLNRLLEDICQRQFSRTTNYLKVPEQPRVIFIIVTFSCFGWNNVLACSFEQYTSPVQSSRSWCDLCFTLQSSKCCCRGTNTQPCKFLSMSAKIAGHIPEIVWWAFAIKWFPRGWAWFSRRCCRWPGATRVNVNRHTQIELIPRFILTSPQYI